MEKKFDNAWNNLNEDKQREIKLKVFEKVDVPAIENMLSILNEIQPMLSEAVSAIDKKDSQKGIELIKKIEGITTERMSELHNLIEKSRNNK